MRRAQPPLLRPVLRGQGGLALGDSGVEGAAACADGATDLEGRDLAGGDAMASSLLRHAEERCDRTDPIEDIAVCKGSFLVASLLRRQTGRLRLSQRLQ